jgi:hypothetical protein
LVSRADLLTALDCAGSVPGGFSYVASFAVLGGHVLVRARHARCLAGIEDHLSAARIEPWTTPDQIVECTWPEAGRYLFRSRSSRPGGVEPLAGVRVFAHGQVEPARAVEAGEAGEWPFTDPPLPAFRLSPFRDRFVGLHAAAVALPAGGVLVAGARGAGKSTVALDLVNHLGGALLTDETVFLHRRTAIVEPYACPVGIWEDGRLKRRAPATLACRRVATAPAAIGALVLLRRVPGPAGVKSLGAAEAFQGMLSHHVDVGSSPDEAMITLAMLARQVPAATATWCSYPDLAGLPVAILEWLATGR